MILAKARYQIIIFSLLLLASEGLSAQQKELYSNAFKYINNRYSHKRLFVVDTLLQITLSDFSEEMAVEWKTSPAISMKLLDSIDRSQALGKSTNNSFDQLRTKGSKPTKLIYFSNLYKRMLIAYVLDMNGASLNYNSQAGFNKVTEYLFLLDENFRIRKVFTKLIQYD